jgi:hypothetical protein
LKGLVFFLVWSEGKAGGSILLPATEGKAIMLHMKNERMPAEAIVEKGKRIYQERLRQLLEPAHNGEFVVIDVETGEYEVDRQHLAATDRAAAKRPGALLYATRVGQGSFARLGGQRGSARR